MKKTIRLLTALPAFLFASCATTGKVSTLDMVEIPGTDIEMLRTEVTQTLYESVMGVNPSDFKGNDNPVECVSWYDAIYFCNKLSVLHELTPVYAVDGESDVSKWEYEPNSEEMQFHEIEWTVITHDKKANGYRLPTYDEWTKAAEGGETFTYAGSNSIDEVAWYEGNSEEKTHPVAQKKPNGYGLYDMCGNVDEWMWDRDEEESPDMHYLRGGGWRYDADECEINAKKRYTPADDQFPHIGFRIVRRAK